MQLGESDGECTIGQLRRLVDEFVSQRNWQEFHNPKNLSMALTVEAGELMEHFQWLTTEQVVSRQGYDLEQVADELADVTSYVLALSNALGIDLSSAVTRKMIKNRQKYPTT
jgi:NTP pyrophosphatase (non-canonical NTP hydrolase)